VRHFVDARYFDLERPSDLQVFSGDIGYVLQNLKEPLIRGIDLPVAKTEGTEMMLVPYR
jgi:hypothetical protein